LLHDFPRPITILAVNNGFLLPEVKNSRVQILNLEPVGPSQYEALLNASDLFITENRISVSLAKAIYLRKHCAVLHNSRTICDIVDCSPEPVRLLAEEMERVRLGSIFPFEVFPIWARNDLENLGIAHQGDEIYRMIEIFGGEQSAQEFQDLLIDSSSRERMRAVQSSYLSRVQSLPSPLQVLQNVPTHALC
jgi:hypothetical protein